MGKRKDLTWSKRLNIHPRSQVDSGNNGVYKRRDDAVVARKHTGECVWIENDDAGKHIIDFICTGSVWGRLVNVKYDTIVYVPCSFTWKDAGNPFLEYDNTVVVNVYRWLRKKGRNCFEASLKRKKNTPFACLESMPTPSLPYIVRVWFGLMAAVPAALAGSLQGACQALWSGCPLPAVCGKAVRLVSEVPTTYLSIYVHVRIVMQVEESLGIFVNIYGRNNLAILSSWIDLNNNIIIS